MSLKTVCRLCLAMDAPMRVITDYELLGVYEKLISTSLNPAHWPVLACYLCFSQLRKCHKLMMRSVRIDQLLTKLFLSGDVLADESISMLSSVRNELSIALNCTPVEIIAIDGIEDNLIKTEVKDEPESSQSTEMEMDPLMCEGHLKCEESEDEADMDISALNDERQELIHEEAIKEEMIDIEEHDLPYEDVQQEESEEAKCMNNMKHKGAAPTGNCKREIHEEERTTSSADEENIQEKAKTRGTRGLPSISTSALSSTKDVPNRQFYKYSHTAINNSNVRINIDNDSNINVDRSDEHLNKMFICDDCGNIFDDKYLLIDHIEHHNVVKKNSDHRSSKRLILRKQRLSRKIVVNKRTEIGSGKNIFECKICQRKYSRKGNLERHLEKHEKPIQCEICKAKFNKNSLLIMHLRKHTGEKPFQCEICKDRFIHKDSLKIHMRIHTGEKPFECHICKERFIRMGYLKTHLLKHTGEKPFECDTCQARFRHKSSLRTHFPIHTDRLKQKTSLNKDLPIQTHVKFFECEICKLKIRRKGDYTIHVLKHTGQKPLECEICQFRFYFKRDLNRHLLTHTKDKPFECDICNVRFRRKYYLKLHLQKHTGVKPFACEICGVTFAQKSILKKHLLIHTGEKPFECETCKVRFRQKCSLNIHILTHTGEKPFVCEICNVKFYQKSSLNRHLRTNSHGSKLLNVRRREMK